MLLGSDFFVSHHVFVANSQHKLYVTYNGGPVFNLTKTTPAGAAQAAEAPKDEAPSDGQVGAAADEHADPDALARRGEASAARRDFEHALADLSKAIELRPGEPEYLYQRAMAYRQSGQAALALADLDHAITLNQDFLRAYLPRGEIRLHEKNVDGAIALKTMPKNPFALYGRGVAKIRKNKTADGEIDIAEAVKIAPNIGVPFSKRGLAP